MQEQGLLRSIKELSRNKPFLRQTMLYPKIDEEFIKLIRNDFPEFNFMEETPLVFCKCYSETYSQPRWIFITNKRFYFRVAISPPNLTALDYMDLQDIRSFNIHYRWVLNYIEINGKSIGTIIISSIREILFLKKVIKTILNNFEPIESIKRNTSTVNYYPICEWQHLQNAGVFPLVNEFFQKYNKGGRLWGFQFFYTHPFIKLEKMDLARQEYANYDPNEEIPIFLVENVGTNVAGIVITNKFIYYNLALSLMKDETKNKVALNSIKSFRIKSRYFGWIFINNHRKGFTNAFDFFDRKAAKVFQDIVNLIIKEIT